MALTDVFQENDHSLLKKVSTLVRLFQCFGKRKRKKKKKKPGPSCSKLTTSLVNDSLKFTSSDTQIVLLKKATHIFSAKNIRILYIESLKQLMK